MVPRWSFLRDTFGSVVEQRIPGGRAVESPILRGLAIALTKKVGLFGGDMLCARRGGAGSTKSISTDRGGMKEKNGGVYDVIPTLVRDRIRLVISLIPEGDISLLRASCVCMTPNLFYASLVRRAIRQAMRIDSRTLVLKGRSEVRIRLSQTHELTGTWSSPDDEGSFRGTEELNRCIEDLRVRHQLLGAWSDAEGM